MNAIPLERVNWCGDKAMYKTTIDDGYAVSVTSLRIEQDTVTLYESMQSHSEIIPDDNFDCGYDSISEYSSWWIFTYDGKTLKLIDQKTAG